MPSKRTDNKSKLTPEQRRFVDEYLRDFDAYEAALRSGIPKLMARKRSEQLILEPLIASEIAKSVDAIDAMDLVSEQRTISWLLREANNVMNNGATRVTAIKELRAAIKDLREQRENEKSAKDGGVMQVPGMLDLDDWERLAANAQRQLKEDVRK